LWQGQVVERFADDDLKGDVVRSLKQSSTEEYKNHFDGDKLGESTQSALPIVGHLEVAEDPNKLIRKNTDMFKAIKDNKIGRKIEGPKSLEAVFISHKQLYYTAMTNKTVVTRFDDAIAKIWS